MSGRGQLLVVHWEWTHGPHAGGRFWGAHDISIDGRIADWPEQGLKPLGAAIATVIDGEGLELLDPIAAATKARRLSPSPERRAG